MNSSYVLTQKDKNKFQNSLQRSHHKIMKCKRTLRCSLDVIEHRKKRIKYLMNVIVENELRIKNINFFDDRK